MIHKQKFLVFSATGIEIYNLILASILCRLLAWAYCRNKIFLQVCHQRQHYALAWHCIFKPVRTPMPVWCGAYNLSYGNCSIIFLFHFVCCVSTSGLSLKLWCRLSPKKNPTWPRHSNLPWELVFLGILALVLIPHTTKVKLPPLSNSNPALKLLIYS